MLPNAGAAVVWRGGSWSIGLSVNSMTGFARAEGGGEGCGWTWEAKSVNGRNLDMRFRMPSGFDALEQRLRELVTERFVRGNLALTLTLDRGERQVQLRVNQALLDEVLALSAELGGKIDATPPSIDGLLAVRGVIEQAEEDETAEERDRLERDIASSLGEGLDRLAAARAEEGARLAGLIAGHLDEIGSLTAAAKKSAAAQPAALQARLKEQLAELLDGDNRVAEDRLAQEVALLAAKADVREELDRLDAHIAAARELLAAGGAIGRRFDFLCQEFNREANTLCSKSPDTDLTRIGLDLKAAVERLREQVQNVE